MTTHQPFLIGVISDTHGLLRHEAIEALAGVDLIIHAGDIGKLQVLEGLKQIAPTIAIRGNVDKGDWASGLPHQQCFEVARKRIYLIHNLKELGPERINDCDIVISGHSHKPLVQQRNHTLFLNPGSAGPRRFSLPVTVAQIRVEETELVPQIIELQII